MERSTRLSLMKHIISHKSVGGQPVFMGCCLTLRSDGCGGHPNESTSAIMAPDTGPEARADAAHCTIEVCRLASNNPWYITAQR